MPGGSPITDVSQPDALVLLWVWKQRLFCLLATIRRGGCWPREPARRRPAGSGSIPATTGRGSPTPRRRCGYRLLAHRFDQQLLCGQQDLIGRSRPSATLNIMHLADEKASMVQGPPHPGSDIFISCGPCEFAASPRSQRDRMATPRRYGPRCCFQRDEYCECRSLRAAAPSRPGT
jgi:hypothetical protein